MQARHSSDILATDLAMAPGMVTAVWRRPAVMVGHELLNYCLFFFDYLPPRTPRTSHYSYLYRLQKRSSREERLL
jgi:hypothetical protein